MRLSFKKEPNPEAASLAVPHEEVERLPVRQAGWTLYRDRDSGAQVRAKQMDSTFRVTSEHGTQEGVAGDYILKHPTLGQQRWPAAVFEARFAQDES